MGVCIAFVVGVESTVYFLSTFRGASWPVTINIHHIVLLPIGVFLTCISC